MKHKPNFAQGLLIALGLAVFGTIGFSAATFFGFTYTGTVQLLAGSLTLTYLLYLLNQSTTKIGRPVVLLCWAAVTTITYLLPISLTGFLLIQGLMLWLVRSLYFHNGLLSAGADLVLVGLGSAALVWASLTTGSIFLAIWCFFLTQALFTGIPNRGSAIPEKSDTADGSRDFDAAHELAQQALKRLV